jgi:hypothetical protein
MPVACLPPFTNLYIALGRRLDGLITSDSVRGEHEDGKPLDAFDCASLPLMGGCARTALGFHSFLLFTRHC